MFRDDKLEQTSSFRQLGKSGPIVSSIGYGCMGISEFYGRLIPKVDAIKLIQDAYHKYGTTFFDTADMYGKGLSEEILGEAVAPFRDKVVIASKCGISRNDGAVAGGISMANSPEYIQKACENSLKRLKMDCIDVYFLHRHDPDYPIEVPMKAMLELIKQGKIKYVGLSEVPADVIKKAHAILGDKLVAVQTEYSFQNREAAEAVLPICRELGISFVAYSPVGRGLLSGAYRDPSMFGKDGAYDIRVDALPQFEAGNLEHNLKLVDAINELAAKKNATSSQIALAWLLAQGQDIVPIPGTSNLKHLIENMKASHITLSSNDLEQLDKIYKNNPMKGGRYSDAVLQVFKMKS